MTHLRPPISSPSSHQNMKKVSILRSLQERLVKSPPLSRCLIFGLPVGYGGITEAVGISAIKYTNDVSLEDANRTLPYGFSLIGVAEFDGDESQDVYGVLEQVDQGILFKVDAEKEVVLCSTGLDFLNPLAVEVIEEADFWLKDMITFRITGQMLLSSLLEPKDIKNCFEGAKKRVVEQSNFILGKKQAVVLLSKEGKFACQFLSGNTTANAIGKGKVGDLVKQLGSDNDVGKDDKARNLYLPPATVVTAKIMFDHTIATAPRQHSLVVVFEKAAACKYFRHHVNIDVLVVIPANLQNTSLYEHFNAAVCNQLELGFHHCITEQLVNSISAENPQIYHFWPAFANHFISVAYPMNTPLEKLRDIRLNLHSLYFVRETRPYFRQSGAVFQSLEGLVNPHSSLQPKFSETELVKGNYEYRHYMQEGFNDDGWGCAYRSLQTIVSWFRLQGFTSRDVPSHREIQECLVSLGDKPQSFIGSKQWIGSTEVSFVLEALLGVSCRIMSLKSGGEMASRINEIQSHFRIHGTPIMVGGGVLAHTIIGASCQPDSETDVNFLVLDPHYTGKDELKTILGKGWVGWKDNNFWSKKDFYNLCMPLLPATI